MNVLSIVFLACEIPFMVNIRPFGMPQAPFALRFEKLFLRALGEQSITHTVRPVFEMHQTINQGKQNRHASKSLPSVEKVTPANSLITCCLFRRRHDNSREFTHKQALITHTLHLSPFDAYRYSKLCRGDS